VLIIIDAGTPQRGGSSGSRFCTDGRRIHDAAHDGGFEAAFTSPGHAKVGRAPAVGEAAFGHEHNVGAEGADRFDHVGGEDDRVAAVAAMYRSSKLTRETPASQQDEVGTIHQAQLARGWPPRRAAQTIIAMG